MPARVARGRLNAVELGACFHEPAGLDEGLGESERIVLDGSPELARRKQPLLRSVDISQGEPDVAEQHLCSHVLRVVSNEVLKLDSSDPMLAGRMLGLRSREALLGVAASATRDE